MSHGLGQKRPRETEDGDPSPRTGTSGAVSAARKKFLEELRRYADDDDELDGGSGPNTFGGNGGRRHSAASEHAGGDDGTLFDDDSADGQSGGADGRPQPALARRIGRTLLQAMYSEGGGSDAGEVAAPALARTYTPLSTGGFLSVTGGDDSGDLAGVAAGDVLVLLEALPPPAANARADSTGTQETRAAAPRLTSRFRREAEMSAEERRDGRPADPAMVAALCEAGRVDRQRRALEAVFLDGARRVLRFTQVRRAGNVERAQHARWKADPSSRPLRTIGTATPAASAPDNTTTTTTTTTSSSVPAGPPPAKWWVLPRLQVRVVSEAAGELFGRKAAVVRVLDRGVGKVRLRLLGKDGGPGAAAGAEEVDVLHAATALETVVPRVGERGLLVLGPHVGEVVEVRRRVRGPDGDLHQVEVLCARNQQTWTVAPTDISKMAE